MRIISGYRVEILKLHRPLERTLRVCREAVDWLHPVMEREWEALSMIGSEKRRFNAAEKLIHTTARNRAKYAFDAAFPKMPSYLRRAVLQHVLGGYPQPGHVLTKAPMPGTTTCRSSIRTTCTGKKKTVCS